MSEDKADPLYVSQQACVRQMKKIDDLTKEIFDLKKQVTFLKESRSKWAKQSSDNADLSERNSAERVEGAYEILIKYGNHKHSCQWFEDAGPCNCGWTEAISTLKARESLDRFCKKHGLIRCECPEEMGLSLAELKALEKVADASEKLFSKRDRKQISDRDFDGNLRHRKGSSPVDFLNHWLKLCRPHAYATQDDSWGELEKLLAIILRNYVNLKVFVKPQIKSALDALKQLRGGKNEM